MIVKSHGDILRPNTEVLISCEDTEPDPAPEGLKIPLFKHQSILVKEIIDFMKSRRLKIEGGGQAASKNVWIKSDIGTGKTLIYLSVLQHFKNTEYKDVSFTVPLRSDIMRYVSAGSYPQVYNENFSRMEILKQSGMIFEDDLHQEFVNFTNHRAQSIVFCQNQVIMQFAEYIDTQTSLSYYLINGNEDFVKYLIDYDDINQDILLWNADKIDVPTCFNGIANFITHIAERCPEMSIMRTIDTLRQYYQIDQAYNFNTFWIEHMNKRQRAPFFTCAYDDFDIMRLPEFQPVPSLYNVFIGSTMIEKAQQNTNVCSAFIFNTLVNRLSSFRIVPEELQKILALPKVNVYDKVCKAPSHVYAQFRFMEYVCKIFKIYKEIIGTSSSSAKASSPRGPSQDDYQTLLYGKMNFQDLNQKCLQPYGLVNKYLQYRLQILVQIVQQLRSLLKCNVIEQSRDSSLREQLPALQGIMSEAQDNVFFNDIKRQPQSQIQSILNKLCDKVPNFEWNEKEMEELCIEDALTHTPLKNPVMCVCCGTLFNYENLHLALCKNGAVYCCNFCKTQIQNVQRNYIWKEEYLSIDHDTLVFTPMFNKSIIYTGQTKLQTLYETLEQKRGKRVMIYMEDQIILDREYVHPQDIISLPDTSIESIVSLRPLSIERYQQNQDYTAFRQEQERQLEYIVSVLQQTRDISGLDYNRLKEAYVQKYPDALLVQSLKQIIGENMIYIDDFIFFNVPESKDEYLQIVGRSNRIGRKEENDVYMLYYPNEKKLS